jgi:DNA-binding LytR/AlgR family response regulator
MRRDYSQQLGQRIVIHGKTKTQYLNVTDITHINCEDTLVITHTSDFSISANKQLSEFEDELSDLGFIRINRSTLINQAHIKSYTGGEKKTLELINGITFSVSRRRAFLFK